MFRCLAPRLENNLWKMKAMRLFYWSHLFAAVLVPFFRDWGGLDYTHIMLLNAWFWFCSFLLEIPTGTVADVYGRKVSIVLGVVAAGIAVLVYGSTPMMSVFLAGELIFAVSMALISGADDALVYDTLAHLGREDEAKRAFSQLESYKLAGIVVGSLLGAPIAAALGVRAPMLLQAIPFAIAALFAATLVEPGGRPAKRDRAAYFEMLWSGVRYFRGHPELRVLTFDMVATGSLAWLIIWFYQPQLEHAGVAIAFFGLVHAAMSLSQIAVLHNVERLERLVGSKRRYLFLSALAPGIAYVTLGLNGWVPTTLAAILFAAAFGLTRQPLFIAYMNNYIPSDRRATVLSTVSMVRTIAVATINPVAGWLADWSLQRALLIFGVISIGLALLSRVREEHLGADVRSAGVLWD